jgi:hypothetical protein
VTTASLLIKSSQLFQISYQNQLRAPSHKSQPADRGDLPHFIRHPPRDAHYVQRSALKKALRRSAKRIANKPDGLISADLSLAALRVPR